MNLSSKDHLPESPAAADHAAVENDQPDSSRSFPIVGVGASAGGLEAFTLLLKQLPLDTGMGFVLVQHLDPQHESALTQILTRATTMPVREVTNNLRVEANHVYIIPPNTSMAIAQGVLKLQKRKQTPTPHYCVDSFFESLAQDQRERAIGVVLSGTASDGTLGLEAIKAEGGITFAQDDSARYDSMPRSAIAAGCVDFVLSPENIANELTRIAKHPYIAGRPPEPASPEGDRASSTAHEDDETPLPSGGHGTPRSGARQAHSEAKPGRDLKGAENGFKKIILLLRNHCGVDFSLYKSTTIQRRITRRMVLNKQDAPEDYADFLRGNVQELDALYSDVLISVTSFFRNPEAFEVLQKRVFPKLLQQHGDDPLRVWTLGCSTGQEAYSLAMAFVESAEKSPRTRKLQVFATDLNDVLLDKARHGLYAKSLAADISPERLRRFFVEEEGGYRIVKLLREMVVFARQNLISDPPFSRIDLISCRNLLIYLEPSLQQKAFPTFHYALKPDGFLFLGASESIGRFTDLFEPADKRHKIYVKKAAPSPGFHLPIKKERGDQAALGRSRHVGTSQLIEKGQGGPLEDVRGELNAQREADRVTVNQFAPPGVLINSELQILQFRGPTSAYLEPPTGKASFDVLKMAREGLMLPLRAAINKAKKENQTTRKENVRVDSNGNTRTVNVEVIPLKNLRERCFLILFEDSDKAGRAGDDAPPTISTDPRKQPKTGRPSAKRYSRRINELETDLSETRDYLQSIQEQHEAANEELQASNEEVQSANEELQSVNEELETSKEELESANEELTTVNEEMANRNAELNRLNSDLVNLQTSACLAILVLGRDLTIRRFSPQAEKQFHLLAADLGRPISGLRHNLKISDLGSVVAAVVDTVREQECDVQDDKGRWYSLRVRPYMTLDNKVEGAVLVLVDIDTLKQSERAIAVARDYAEAIVRTTRDPLLILNADLRVHAANEAFYSTFKTSAAESEGRFIYDLGNAQWNIPKLRNLLENILPRDSFFDNFEIEHDFERLGRRTMLLNARVVKDSSGQAVSILLGIQDITERSQTETLLASHRQGLEMLAKGEQIEQVLDFLAISMESQSRGDFLVAIHLMEADGHHFGHVAAPSLPAGYTQATKGMDARLQMGPCSAAVVAHEPTVVRDFAAETRWPVFTAEALSLGLRGCFTTPIFSSDQKILGTFAIYYREPRDPSPSDLRLVEIVTRTASIAIERRWAEKALLESERRLRFVMDSAPQKIFTAKPNGDMDYCNPQWTEFTGLSFDQIRDWGWTQFIHPDDVAENVRVWRHSIDTGEPFHFEHRFRHANGEYRWHLSRAVVLNDAGGKVLMWVGSNTDVHEVKEADLRKNEFLAMLGHELRNPLAPIRHMLEILKRADGNGDLIEQARNTMDRQLNQMTRLIDDLLDVSRISRGKMELRREPSELASIIRHAVEACRPGMEAASHDLKVEQPQEPVYLDADPVRLAQVFGNLLTNACKFSEPGGRISLTIQREGGDVVISVKDAGLGIPKDKLPRIFEMFTQLDQTLERTKSGLGIGLSLVQRLVEMHGGSVQAISEGLGQGSEFVVRLPEVIEKPKRQPSEPAVSEPKTLTAHRILVVDDNRDAADALAMLLELTGNEIQTAHDGIEAVNAAATFKPDVVLLDIGLPKLNGYDACRRIREQPWGKDMILIALTGWGQDEDRRKSHEAGLDGHLVKPVEYAALMKLLAALLPTPV